MSNLSVSRASDRKRMVAATEAVCVTHDALCLVTTPSYIPRGFRFEIKIGNASLYFDIDGDSRQQRQGVCVGTWNLSYDAVRSGYRFRYRAHDKLTRVWHGFDDLLSSLADDLQSFSAALMVARYQWTVYNRTTRTDPLIQSFSTEYDAHWCARDWRAAWPNNVITVERETL